MTYGHLLADCLYTGISSGPNAWYRVWEAFTFFNHGQRAAQAYNEGLGQSPQRGSAAELLIEVDFGADMGTSYSIKLGHISSSSPL